MQGYYPMPEWQVKNMMPEQAMPLTKQPSGNMDCGFFVTCSLMASLDPNIDPIIYGAVPLGDCIKAS